MVGHFLLVDVGGWGWVVACSSGAGLIFLIGRRGWV